MIRAGGVKDRLTARNRLAEFDTRLNSHNLFNSSCSCPLLNPAGHLKEIKTRRFTYAKRNNRRIYCNGGIICAVDLDDVRSFTMITKEKMREYLQIAVLIDSGAISVPLILEDFQEHQERAAEMVNFWLTFDEFTQKVVHYLAIEKLRIHFENCYRKEYECLTMKQSLNLIANGLKQILFGAKECIIGVLKDIVEL